MTLSPGEGAFISSPSAHTVTFVGEVQLSSDVSIPAGFSIISSVVPQNAPVDTLGFPAAEGDIVFQYNPANGGYIANDFADGAWERDNGGTAPTPAIGESFFVSHKKGTPTAHWTRTFTVN